MDLGDHTALEQFIDDGSSNLIEKGRPCLRIIAQARTAFSCLDDLGWFFSCRN
jgi:hypothetical protein